VRRQQTQLEESDRQLAGQAGSIAEMQSALTELQTAVDANTANGHAKASGKTDGTRGTPLQSSNDYEQY